MPRVAIVGTSFRFPGTSAATFWNDLLAGRDLITQVAPDRWAAESFLHPNRSHPGSTYTFAAGTLGDIAGFDAGFFGISPREAALMDPQQRLLLEMSWEALENAGIKPSTLRGSQCGVFIGIASTDYSYRMADDLAAIDASFATGNTASIAANRLSYIYDLHGPSMAIDTACSSSLVAFHQACRSIETGESSQALAGGISLHLHPCGFISFAKASMLSKRGRCQVFDAAGDGYVRSEGGGLFFLKDYDQAVADGNPILAVVVHSAVNTDGRKSGLTVPNPQAQAALLTRVYTAAGIDPMQVDYIEAHGTGTAVGDPIEARALGDALGRRRSGASPLPVGSIKSNLGHLEAASGVAGLVKALHCLRHRMVPATIGITNPNPNIHFDELNIEVVTANKPLRSAGKLVVGVNSFGFGGANAHVILENHEAPKAIPLPPAKGSPLPLLVSARDEAALRLAAGNLGHFITRSSKKSLYDIAYRTVHGREWHEHRAVVFGTTPGAIAEALEQFANGERTSAVESGSGLAAPRGPAFVYSGNGTQWAGMGKGLLADPVFRQAVQEVDRLFARFADFSLEAELAGRNGDGRYELTEFAQPALFAVQVGITRMLRHRGLVPTAVAGHSVGEVAAAWASEALTLSDAVEVIFYRSRLQGTTKGAGRMMALGMGEPAALELLDELELSDHLVIAGINSSRGVTIAGSARHLDQLDPVLAERNIVHKRLDLDYAFHSPAMDGTQSEIRRSLADLRPGDTSIPFYSTVTGGVLAGPALDAEYWWRNIREPVRFEQAVKAMASDGLNIYLEIGPHSQLRGYINDSLADSAMTGRIIPTGKRGDDTARHIWTAASAALIAGAQLDWQRLLPWQGGHVDLPNYPWQRERYWHPVTHESQGLLYRTVEHPLLGYPLRQQDLTWESRIDTHTHPLLADHVVGETVLFPGSAYAELALSAAFAWHPGQFAEIEDIEIRTPLALSEERTRTVRFSIDGGDGTFSVNAREQLSGDPWTQHASGRILREARDIRLNTVLASLPTRQPDFNGHSHEALTIAAGLGYGPAFKAIDYGWIAGSSALAAFQIPANVEAEIDKYHLHPTLLDCAFQLIIQLIKDDLAAYDGITFVPARIGHITCRGDRLVPRYARATLISHSPHSIAATFELFDASLRPIAVIDEARFRSVRLRRNATDHIRYLEYRAIANPLPESAAVISCFPGGRVDGAIQETFRRAILKGTHRLYSEQVDPLLDGLCSRFTAEAFAKMASVDLRDGAAEPSDVPADAMPYFRHLLALAHEDGLLQSDKGASAAEWGSSGETSAQDIWNSLIGDFPDYFEIIHSVGRIGMHLPSLLGGGAALDQVWPSDTSLASLLRRVLGTESRVKIGNALRSLVAAGMRDLPEGKRLGIVEASEGAPLFATDCCQALDFDRADYIFVSTSTATIGEANALQEKFPAISLVSVADDGTSQEPGRLPATSFQLAIVTLDFLATRDALKALDFVRGRLSPGGTILVLGLHPARWVDFVFGRNREWWHDSTDERLLSRQLPVQFWQQQLENLGFSFAKLQEFSPDTASGPYMLIARAKSAGRTLPQPVESHSRCWLLLADEDGYSDSVARHLVGHLRDRGDRVVRARPGDAEQLSALLLDTAARYGTLDGILHLAGLDRVDIAANAAAMLDRQVDRCATAAALIQACEDTGTTANCWFVTAGAATHLLPRRSAAGASAPADAALWGFGRTLMNEATACTVRLVDLEDAADIGAVITALARELGSGDREQEVALSATGERFTPRLRLTERPHPYGEVNPGPGEHRPTRLGFSSPGQLRNLRWEACQSAPPGKDQIEVQVRATGLNFRDVMYALGLLSDEAVENGFAGASLGLEFAGIVTSVGPQTLGFAPGDNVVGFGPSSFADRVVTRSSALAHIPPGMSFEGAATIPSTFFTAYYALHHLARLQEGERVLIHGAAGGVGIAAIQVAKWCGAEIYATAGSDEKRDFLRLLGVDRVLDSRTLAFADEILAATDGRGVDVILNSLAGEAINRNLRVLKPFGRFLELGKRDFYENTRVGLRPFRNNISYFGIDADQLMNERPDLTKRLFAEVMALFADGTFHPLPYRAFEAEEIVDAFRYMQQARQIGKIVVTYGNGIPTAYRPSLVKAPRLELPAEASYLVTGGLGGFGLKTAQWLAQRGARHLVLISRSGPASDEARIAIAALEQSGVTVFAKACDVTDRTALSALVAEIADKLPPLRGVVHAAMVVDDGLIRHMSADRIRRVLAPKVLGARYLHELTQSLPLDLFVLYSSATTLFGNPGQGNYVAANAAIEALARQRRAAGLPATCVRWGAIDDAGFLARNPAIKDALQARMGGSALNSAVALDALESLLLADRSDLGVLELDWKALSRFLPSAGSPKFAELARQGADGEADEDSADDIHRLLAELSGEELAVTFVEMIKQEVGEILRVAPDKIDASRSVYDMGLDSLMGVELLVALEARFGLRLPAMALTETPNIAKLADRLITQLRDTEPGAMGADEATEIQSRIEQVASQHASDVSAEEVARIAERINDGKADAKMRMIR